MTNKWDTLPNEILRDILLVLKNENKSLCQCALVKKQWLDTGLPILYKSLTLDFEAKNAYRTLLNSRFRVGRHVKEIFLLGLRGSAIEVDQLVQLVVNCPNVEKLDWLSVDDEELVQKVFKALCETNLWKLRSLPTEVDSDISTYHGFADMMQGSLETITVNGLRDGGKYDFLQKYTKITQVTMMRANDLADCIQLFKFTPHLTNLRAFLFNASKINNHSNRNDISAVPTPRGLKKVHLINYTPASDQEFQLIMEKFKDVSTLKIQAAGGESPMTMEGITMPVMESFMKFIQSIPEYSFSVSGQDEMEWLKAYFFSMDGRSENNNKTDLTINFDPKFEINPSLEIKNNNCLKYLCALTRPAAIQEKLNAILGKFGQHIQKLSIQVPPSCGIRVCLGIVFEKCPKLTHLTLKGGYLDQPEFGEHPQNRYQTIKYLVLEGMKMKGPMALVYLSMSFNYLESIQFIDCNEGPKPGEEEEEMGTGEWGEDDEDSQLEEDGFFGEYDRDYDEERVLEGKPDANNISFGMDSTDFGSLNIIQSKYFAPADDYDEIREKVIFFAVMTSNEENMKYFVKYDGKDIKEIASSTEFYSMEYECKYNARTYNTLSLNMNVKSFKTFSFKSQAFSFNYNFI